MNTLKRFRVRYQAGAALVATVITSTVLLLGFLLISPKPIAAQQNKEGVGEDVGNFQRITCPPQTYLVGLKTTVDFWLDFAQIYCAGFDERGDWTTTASIPSQSPSFILRGWGFDPNQLDIIQANTHALSCPLDTYVTGLNPGVATVTHVESGVRVVNQLPWHTMVVCRRRLTGAVQEQGYPPTQWGSDQGVSGSLIGWDGMTGRRSCDSTEVGVGVWAMVGDNIRKFGMVCQPFESVRPKTMRDRETAQMSLKSSTSITRRQPQSLYTIAETPMTGSKRLNPARAAVSEGAPISDLCKRNPALCKGSRP